MNVYLIDGGDSPYNLFRLRTHLYETWDNIFNAKLIESSKFIYDDD